MSAVSLWLTILSKTTTETQRTRRLTEKQSRKRLFGQRPQPRVASVPISVCGLKLLFCLTNLVCPQTMNVYIAWGDPVCVLTHIES